MEPVIAWIEKHQVTVGLLQSLGLLIIAWASGVFAFLRRYSRKPIVRVIPTASFAFVEEFEVHNGAKNAARVSFVLNVAVTNRTEEKIVVDEFSLAFKTRTLLRSWRQHLLRIPFPVRPQKRVGEGRKLMGVWFTEFPVEDFPQGVISGTIEGKESQGGYLLFVSFTHGAWNPKITTEGIPVELRAELTTGEVLTHRSVIRVVTDPIYVSEFCPKLPEHVAHESTWNHDLSVIK